MNSSKLEIQRVGKINDWKPKDFCVAFDKPVESYKTKDEMLDAIFGGGIVKSITPPDENGDQQVIVTYCYLWKAKVFKMEDSDPMSVSHLLRSTYAEKSVDSIDLYWEQKEKFNTK